MRPIYCLALFFFVAIQLIGCGGTNTSSVTDAQDVVPPDESEVVLPPDETLDQIQDTEELLGEQGAMGKDPGAMQAAVEDVEGQAKSMNQQELNSFAHEMVAIEQIEEFERQNRMLVETVVVPAF